MDAGALVRRARREAGLSLRTMARRAGTSHSTLAAYEAGAKTPSVPTLERLLRAAGFEMIVELRRSVGGADLEARGRELAEVLDLAEQFPARHTRKLAYPVFGRR
jgi:transcriptional regulator with XRE-family HTH domain